MAFRGVDNDPRTMRDLAQQLDERAEAVYTSASNLNQFLGDLSEVISQSGHKRLSARLHEHGRSLTSQVAHPLQEAARRLERLASQLEAMIEIEDRM